MCARSKKALTAMQRGGRAQNLIDDAFRAIHSIKGGAGMLGFDRIVPFAHVFETTLDGVRLNDTPFTEALMTAALKASDCLGDLVKAAGSGIELPAAFEKATAERIALAAGIDATGDPKPMEPGPEKRSASVVRGRFEIRFKPHSGLLRCANEPLFLVRQLHELGDLEIAADLSGLPALDALGPTDSNLGWTFKLETTAGEASVREIFQFVEGDCDHSIVRRAEPGRPDVDPLSFDADEAGAEANLFDFSAVMPDPAAATIRVDLSRIDRLVNLAEEIAISQTLIDQKLFSENPQLFQELSQLLAHTQNLQDSVMAIRAQPIGTIFDRMPRLAREREQFIRILASAMNDLAKGNLTVNFAIEENDASRSIKQHVNATVERVRGIAQRIAAASGEVAGATRAIGTGVADLSARTEQQASSLEHAFRPCLRQH